MIDKKQTGINIRMKICGAGLTPENIREIFGLKAIGVVYRWLEGINLPSLEHMKVLSDLLGCKIDDLLITVSEADIFRSKIERKREKKNMIPVLNVTETAENIRKRIKASGLSVRDIQATMKIASSATVYQWINGKQLPSLENMKILSDLFECKIDDILVWE